MNNVRNILAVLLLINSNSHAMEQSIPMDLDLALDNLTIALHTLQESLEHTQSLATNITKLALQLPKINTDTLIHFITPLYEKLQTIPKPKDRSASALEIFKNQLQQEVAQDINRNIQKLSSILQPSTPEQVVQFSQILTRMITNGLFEKLTYIEEKISIRSKELFKPTALSACHCIPFAKRIAFNMALLYDIFKQFPHKEKELVYTSMASGGLWQDYLVIQALIWAGYTKIHLNLIDLYYPDTWRLRELQNLEILHADFIRQYMLLYPEQIELFKLRLLADASQVYAQSGTTVALETHLYNNAYEYMVKTKQHAYERTNVLVMVDVEIQRPEIIANFPSLANAIRFTIKDPTNKQPYNHTYAFLPRNKPIQLYQLDLDRLSPDTPANTLIELKTAQQELIRLARTSGATQGYTGKFFPGLETLSNKYYTQAILVNEVPNTEPYFAMFASDIFITFQDMLFDSLANNALVYTLYKRDYGASVETSVIEKVDIEAAKKIDPVAIIEPALRHLDYKKVNLN